jgi:hypothetical protein
LLLLRLRAKRDPIRNVAAAATIGPGPGATPKSALLRGADLSRKLRGI